MNGQEEHGVSYIEHKNPERSQFSFVLLVILSSLFTFKKSPLPTYRPYLRLPPHGGSVVVPTYLLRTYLRVPVYYATFTSFRSISITPVRFYL